MTTKQAQDRGSFVGKVKQSVELQPHVASWLSKFVIRNSGGQEETLDFAKDKVAGLIDNLSAELQRPANDRTNWRFVFNNSTGSGGQPNKYVVSMDPVYVSDEAEQLFPEEPASKATAPVSKATEPATEKTVYVSHTGTAPTIKDFLLGMDHSGTWDGEWESLEQAVDVFTDVLDLLADRVATVQAGKWERKYVGLGE